MQAVITAVSSSQLVAWSISPMLSDRCKLVPAPDQVMDHCLHKGSVTEGDPVDVAHVHWHQDDRLGHCWPSFLSKHAGPGSIPHTPLLSTSWCKLSHSGWGFVIKINAELRTLRSYIFVKFFQIQIFNMHLNGRVALLAKITLPITFTILIYNTLMKNSKNVPNFLK